MYTICFTLEISSNFYNFIRAVFCAFSLLTWVTRREKIRRRMRSRGGEERRKKMIIRIRCEMSSNVFWNMHFSSFNSLVYCSNLVDLRSSNFNSIQFAIPHQNVKVGGVFFIYLFYFFKYILYRVFQETTLRWRGMMMRRFRRLLVVAVAQLALVEAPKYWNVQIFSDLNSSFIFRWNFNCTWLGFESNWMNGELTKEQSFDD